MSLITRSSMLDLAVGKGRQRQPWGEIQRLRKQTNSVQEVQRKEQVPSNSYTLLVSLLLAPLFGEPQGQPAKQKPSLQSGNPSFRSPGYRRVGFDLRGNNFITGTKVFGQEGQRMVAEEAKPMGSYEGLTAALRMPGKAYKMQHHLNDCPQMTVSLSSVY